MPTLHIAHKLALPVPKENALSRQLITAAHIALAFNLFTAGFPFSFPILGAFLALLCLSVEHFRRNSMAQEALRFSLRRLMVHVTLSMIGLIGIPIFTQQHTPFPSLALMAVLVPLGMHDAFNARRGRLGITSRDLVPALFRRPKRRHP